jgi:hypothetical protein
MQLDDDEYPEQLHATPEQLSDEDRHTHPSCEMQV